MQGDEEDNYLGLTELLPVRLSLLQVILDPNSNPRLKEPESPPPIPYSFSTYSPSSDLALPLPLPDNRTHLILRLVGNHPLWGHHL